MATLTIATSRDYSAELLFNIGTLDFNAAATATFSGGQFNNVNISRSLHVEGSTGSNLVVVDTDYRGFNASGWTFAAWLPEDRLVIRGSDFGEMLTGSTKRDTINGGNGADTIKGLGGADIIAGGAGADHLSGGAGADTLSYEGSFAGVRVDLATGTALGGDASGDRFSSFRHLLGSSHADTLSGNNAGNRITGGLGADTLRGRGGADTFVFTSLGDSPAGLESDVIADFSHAQGDLMDLSRIDAVLGGSNDDNFTFIGADGFTAAGQLRGSFLGLFTLVEADVDGDGEADFAIRLDGRHALVEADFVL